MDLEGVLHRSCRELAVQGQEEGSEVVVLAPGPQVDGKGYRGGVDGWVDRARVVAFSICAGEYPEDEQRSVNNVYMMRMRERWRCGKHV